MSIARSGLRKNKADISRLTYFDNIISSDTPLNQVQKEKNLIRYQDLINFSTLPDHEKFAIALTIIKLLNQSRRNGIEGLKQKIIALRLQLDRFNSFNPCNLLDNLVEYIKNNREKLLDKNDISADFLSILVDHLEQAKTESLSFYNAEREKHRKVEELQANLLPLIKEIESLNPDFDQRIQYNILYFNESHFAYEPSKLKGTIWQVRKSKNGAVQIRRGTHIDDNFTLEEPLDQNSIATMRASRYIAVQPSQDQATVIDAQKKQLISAILQKIVSSTLSLGSPDTPP